MTDLPIRREMIAWTRETAAQSKSIRAESARLQKTSRATRAISERLRQRSRAERATSANGYS